MKQKKQILSKKNLALPIKGKHIVDLYLTNLGN